MDFPIFKKNIHFFYGISNSFMEFPSNLVQIMFRCSRFKWLEVISVLFLLPSKWFDSIDLQGCFKEKLFLGHAFSVSKIINS